MAAVVGGLEESGHKENMNYLAADVNILLSVVK
jgi:hypothetical protein